MGYRSLLDIDNIPSSELFFPKPVRSNISGGDQGTFGTGKKEKKARETFWKGKKKLFLSAVNIFYSRSQEAFTSQDKKPHSGWGKIRFD